MGIGQQDSYAILRIPKKSQGRQNPKIMKKILLNTLTSLKRAPSPRGWFVTALLVACFALSPQMQALSPPPDGGYPNGNTAEGDSALLGLTGGFYNSAVGFLSLLSNADASFNTGLGAGTLLLNTASENTAVGAGALLTNAAGGSNTAVGAFALFAGEVSGSTAIGDRALQNDAVGSNTAVGFHAMQNNTGGFNNVAVGVTPLDANTSGNNNTAIGNLSLENSTGNDNVALGRHAGDGITTANNNIVIGHGSGVSTTNGQVDDSCYIGNIFNGGVDAGTALLVFVDQDGKLGTTALPNTGTLPVVQPQAVPQRTSPQAVPDAKQAKLNLKVEKLQATVTQQQNQIEILTAQLKEQAAQIQRVSAQLQVSKPAAQVVSYGK
jgi:hypothetical protein